MNLNIKKKIYINKLKKIIKKGETVFLHVDLSKFVYIFKNSKDNNTFFHFFHNLFSSLVGKNGTIITPSFSYSWKKKINHNLFDLHNTKSKVGFYSNFAIHSKEYKRTLDPLFSVLISGKKKNFYLKIGENSFGENSIYDKLIIDNAKIVLFGIEKVDPTFVHYIEFVYNRDFERYNYRYNKKFSGKIKLKKKIIKKNISCFLRPIKTDIIYNEKKVSKLISKTNIIKKIVIDQNIVQSMYAREFFDFGIKKMRKNKSFFVKNLNE